MLKKIPLAYFFFAIYSDSITLYFYQTVFKKTMINFDSFVKSQKTFFYKTF